MNIYDISKKTGFSTATISRVINNKGNVSKKTTEKIVKAMEQFGYTPNVFARGLGLNSIMTVGILCADASDIYLATAVTVIERELRQYGYDCILCNTGHELSDKKKYLKLLLSKRVDAIVLIGSHFRESSDNDHIIDAASQVPVMLVNAFIAAKNVYCTLCADYDAIFQATTKLIQEGHDGILYCYDSGTYSSSEKLSGYKNAISEAGLPLRQELIVRVPKNIASVQATVLKLFGQSMPFTCAICSEDLIAVGVTKAIQEKGINIPGDFSVIGYDDSLFALCTTPQLTSIDSKVEALCKNAVLTLVGVFAGERVPSKVVISAEMIERGSTRFVK